jgi:hypothetical protein
VPSRRSAHPNSAVMTNDEYTHARAPRGAAPTISEARVIVPTPYDAIPYPEGPRYFVRDWNLARSTLTPLRYNTNRFRGFGQPIQLLGATPGLVRIYGYSCRSPHPEHRELEDWLWERHKAFPAVCFSTVTPYGEYAFTPAAAAVEITLESLEGELERLVASLRRDAS